MNTMTCARTSLGMWTLGCMLATVNLGDPKCVSTI